MNEIEEIKQRLDIVDLVGQYVSLKKAGANYKGNCPFHNEKTASLMVSPAKQIWKCFGCGKGGDQFAFVMEAESLDFGDALRLLAQKTGVTLQSRTQADHQSTGGKERLFRINALASKIFQKLLWESVAGKKVLEYLRSRNVTDATIKEFGVGFVPSGFDLVSPMLKHGINRAELSKAGSPEKFYNRIMFPIFDVLGNVVGFTGRALGDIQPKYLNTPETQLFNKSRVLYGLNFAKSAIKQADYVVLVEGQMDVIALSQGGVKQVVASSGTAFTERQLQILSKYTTNFLLAFDNDTAGQTATKKVIEMLLHNDLTGKVVDFAPYKDAGELLEKADIETWKKAVKKAVEGVEWLVQQEVAQAGDMQFVENKRRVIKAMLPMLSLITDETRLDHYVQRLALITESKPDSVYAALEKTTAPASSSPAPATGAPVEIRPLTNEEQLLALVLAYPALLTKHHQQLAEVVWQSVDAARIAESVQFCYNTETKQHKVINQNLFFNSVKNHVTTPSADIIPATTKTSLADKLDLWQFWLTNSWPNLTQDLAEELISEKLGQLATKSYERTKETIALNIRKAQEQGDMASVKELMNELNKLTKQNKE